MNELRSGLTLLARAKKQNVWIVVAATWLVLKSALILILHLTIDRQPYYPKLAIDQLDPETDYLIYLGWITLLMGMGAVFLWRILWHRDHRVAVLIFVWALVDVLGAVLLGEWGASAFLSLIALAALQGMIAMLAETHPRQR